MAKTDTSKLHVLYQSDDNYAMVSGISIVSLLDNNQHLGSITVHYCDYKITPKNKLRLKTVVDRYPNATLKFINAEPYDKTFKRLGVKPWHGVYVTWLKLLAFGKLKIDTDRVLFINGHTIINGPLDELIGLDFGKNIMALGYDALVNAHKQTIGLRPTDGYYNCGIMLINHAKWIGDDIDTLLKDHLASKSDYVIADQDLCNVLFKNKIKTLPVEYNFSSAYYAYDLKKFLKINDLQSKYFYRFEEIMANYYAPKIIHSLYGVQGKPWEEGNDHPQKYLWRKYIDMTPWRSVKKPKAVKTLTWRLYKLLPQTVFLYLYSFAVKRKFGR